jgi:hypothetical protein
MSNITGKIIIFDDNKPTYNIGDLLNIPYFWAGWLSNPHFSQHHYNSFILTADAYPNSILNIYKTTRTADGKEEENIPNIERLRFSVDVYSLDNDVDVVTDVNTLYVHIRTGDKNVVEDSYVDIIYNLQQNKYSNIIILSGIHSDYRFGSKENNINNLNLSFIKLNNKGIKYSINFDIPDNHFNIMRKCRNLLVHKGGFSIIGALIFNGEHLYITGLFDPFIVTDAKNNNFFSHIKKYELV